MARTPVGNHPITSPECSDWASMPPCCFQSRQTSELRNSSHIDLVCLCSPPHFSRCRLFSLFGRCATSVYGVLRRRTMPRLNCRSGYLTAQIDFVCLLRITFAFASSALSLVFATFPSLCVVRSILTATRAVPIPPSQTLSPQKEPSEYI